MRPAEPIKVLLVDDSALVRSMLASVLAQESDIRVVGGAKDPFEARELIIQHRPDVIVLDIEMPRMDGLTFLRKLMAHYPVPVIMCSTIAPANSEVALRAIEYGAVDVVCKPTTGGNAALRHLGQDLADKIRAAAASRPAPTPPIPASATAIPPSCAELGLDPDRYLVAIGASTGGTEAIRRVLQHVPPDFPPVVMVQHMPPGFTRSFAERLNQLSPLEVKEAAGGEILRSGHAFLARGGIQMQVHTTVSGWKICYGTSEPVNRHCPSVDVLFDSVVPVGRQAIGVILTGMGADGAKGLLKMRSAGALTIAQDQESCVVYGMPRVAVEIGAAEYQCCPSEVPRLILKALRCRRPTAQPATS